jgi:glutathione S-transferase
MKLRFSPTSPYVRKVCVVAIETGLDARIERVETDPWDPETDLGDDNPLGKVPALTTDGGEVLYDSQLISEYLDSLHDGAKLFPAAGGARWRALRLLVLADGTTEAARLRLVQSRRPAEERSAWWMERQAMITERGLDALEAGVDDLGDDLTIGHIAQGCLLGWLDFRFADADWRPSRPRLAAWYGHFSRRPSMGATVPSESA